MNKKIFELFQKKYLKRLTPFDCISTIIVLGLIVFLSLFFFRRQEYIEIEVKLNPPDIYWSATPPYWLSDSVKVGEGEFNSFGKKAVEVLDVRSFEGGGTDKSVFLRLKVLVVEDKKKKTYSFKSEPLEVGSPIELHLSRVFATGLVTYIEGMPDSRLWEDLVIEARLLEDNSVYPGTSGVNLWTAEAIEIGEQMRDSKGMVWAEVLDKKVEAADRIVVTAGGQVLMKKDPLKKDVTLTLKLRTIKQGEVNYFLYDQKIKVGTVFPLYLSQVDFYPEVTKIIR